MTKKLLHISNMAAPYQVKFCYELQTYFDAEFWFYVHLEKNRPEFWKIPLGDKCKILPNSNYKKILGYNNKRLISELNNYNPDYIIVGGFFYPSHYNILKWARKNKKKIIIYSELLGKNSSNKFWNAITVRIRKILLNPFKKADLLLAMGENVVEQFINVWQFPSNKIKCCRYPQDIDAHLSINRHPKKKGDTIHILFPGKLEHLYNPLLAIEIAIEISKTNSNILFHLNGTGTLRQKCEEVIFKNKVTEKITFEDQIKSWNDLYKIYEMSDIIVIPSNYSNGPNTLIEGMAAGMGVVMSDQIQNTNEYFKNNEQGFICPLSKENFIQSIHKYINEPELIYKHGTLNRDAVKFRSAKYTANFYHSILQNI